MKSIDFNTVEQKLLDLLKNYLDLKGAVFYGANNTLKVNDLYIMGINPGGGDGTELVPNLKEDIMAFKNRNICAYTDENWCGGDFYCPEKAGTHKFQKRIKYLVNLFSHDINSVFGTNLIFRQTQDVNNLDFWKEAEAYWPVHDYFISLIRPKLVICIGNSESRSAYSFIKNKFNVEDIANYRAGHGNYKIKYTRISIQNRETYILGIPHISYYEPNKQELLDLDLPNLILGQSLKSA
ncbi:MAG: hypothetical protein CME62_06000 [Halobacteriovoraceae bacterium]|nr:hypothetical protein [Halobacteriovoraceae bacterium]|tara:strand:- start:17721 stop:18434 length:714 start_codon:yes stop_codon:yes gene_type:complete